MTHKFTGTRRSSLTLIILLVCTIHIFPGCRAASVRIGIIKNDLRALSAMVAREQGIFSDNRLKVEVVEYKDPDLLNEALRKGKVDAAFIDARKVLVVSARGEVEVVILAMVNRSEFKPETVLVARTDWAQENRKATGGLIEAHKTATRLIQKYDPVVLDIAVNWTGKNKAHLLAALIAIQFETGMDRVAFIDLLDELRLSGLITSEQADGLASRLVREEGESAGP